MHCCPIKKYWRSFQLPSKCPFCCSIDSMDHSFAGCSLTVEVWSCSGGGYILHDSSGRVLEACSKFFGHGTCFYAELLALMHEVRRCVQLGYTQVMLECDSKLLVDTSWFSWEAMEVSPGLAYSGWPDSVFGGSVVHIFREANKAAD